MGLLTLLAREGCQLLPRGRLLVGVCPHCGGSTPVLQVHGELFRCTRCGLAGGSLQYLLASGKRAVEAARELGIRLTVPKQVLRVLQRARAIYERTLWSELGRSARDYLHSRGIRLQIAPCFHLGATPPPGSLIHLLIDEGFAPTELRAAGLLRGDEGKCVEQLRSRLIFPLCDPMDRTLGFAGRTLCPGALKYLSTRVSRAGSVRDTLFGLPQARSAILRRHLAWIVEGYIDVLACHQVGMDWVVAASGTRLTVLQALQLRRLTPRVVLLLDGGTSSEVVSRAAASLHTVGLEVMAATLPPGIDPDVFVFREGPDALARVAGRAVRVKRQEVATVGW